MESYTLFLNTVNTKNCVNTQPTFGHCSFSFYVNWGLFLPKQYNKFDVTCSLKSDVSTTQFTALCYATINTGANYAYNQKGVQNGTVALILPKSYKTTGSTEHYFESSTTSDIHLQINYPSNDFMSVVINSGGGFAVGFPDFTMKLKFTPIIDTE